MTGNCTLAKMLGCDTIVDRWLIEKNRDRTILLEKSRKIRGKVIMAADTFERVRNIIVEQLGVEPDEVTMEANFRDDLEADSLDLVELIMQFEEEFGGEISDEEAQKIVSVGDAVKFLDN